MKNRLTTFSASLAIGLTVLCGNSQAAAVLPDFAAATFVPNAPISNPYFSLLNDTTRVYNARTPAGNPVDERFEFVRLGAGPTILGVSTTTQRDRAYEEGRLVEDTFDHYAQDSSGNVWYMGEDVTNYVYDAAGNLTGTNTSSSWRAGVNGALPGYQMAATPALGQSFYQEFAATDHALDEGLVSAVGLTLTIGSTTFQNVVQIYETTALDVNFREFKYYAPGVGLIRADETLDANLSNPQLILELAPAVPEPSSALLLLLGLPLALWLRGKKAG